MDEKSLATLLFSFERYPLTQQALFALHERNSDGLAHNAAKVLQTIARDAIPGDFALTPEQLEALNNNPVLLEQIHEVVHVFLTEQSSHDHAGLAAD